MSSKPTTLAVVTASELVLLDSKSTSPARTTLASPSAFAADASNVFVASPHGVAKYGRDSGVHVFSLDSNTDSVSAVCVADSGSVYVAQANVISVYAPGAVEPTQTIEGHSSSITSLTLSCDGTLLASASKTVHVQNLATASRTILRGLPCPNTAVACATFHPSRPTMLFIAISRQLVVYDTSKPAAPSNVVQVAGSAAGDIVAIDCSPFSKSLLAVACSGGIIGIVDLEKEKLLIKTIDTKTGLTSLRFQPDAAIVVAGTTDGRALYYDLRATDKAPQSVVADKQGRPVLGLAWLKRGKPPAAKAGVPPIKAATTGRAPLQDRTSPRQGILKPKAASPAASAVASKNAKTVFSPSKDAQHPLSKSTIGTNKTRTLAPSTSSKENTPAARAPLRAKVLSPKPGTSQTAQTRLAVPPAERKPRTSSSSQASSRIISTRRVSAATTSTRMSHTPSPSLPSESEMSSPPLRKADEKRRDIQALGLGTPGARRRVAPPSSLGSPTRKDEGTIRKRLSWADEEGDTVIPTVAAEVGTDQDRIPSTASAAESISTATVADTNHLLSPARRTAPPPGDWSPVRAALHNSSPHSTLRLFMQELATKDDVKGVQMDMIRMGMALKCEMRRLMEEYVGDLSSLRDENKNLREELERLRNRY